MTINMGGEHVPVTDVDEVDLDAEEIYVDGVRLTEARAAELAREIARRHGRKGGRPSVGSARVAVRLPQETKDRLATIARSRELREADLVRDAINEYLDRHGA
ncbi:MAG TPA: ribbon-helix-helix domain-containing protein [Candidatus Ruania gallistercoris]|uniref:Ribbon-helix-helix domain-containing protein n=1 Tax=Candidatus Ruania gallistercoris TaxID=2838746 RepID=A0A9D2EJ16_9MICO|nr:ribbon-helix-helix domain-containing protein [Candidatus Ruania gallistercoris]